MKTYFIKTALLVATLTLSACSDVDALRSTYFTEKLAELEITPNVVKFGRRSVYSNTHRTFTLTNKGKLPAHITQFDLVPAPFQFKRELPFPGLGGTCPSDLIAPGQSCTFVLTFRPLQVGEFKATWNLSYAELDSTKPSRLSLIEISGEGVDNASLDFSADGIDALEEAFDFGTIALNSVVYRDFHVLYSGILPATSVAWAANPGDLFAGNDQFSFESISCTPNNINHNCLVRVKFAALREGTVEASTQVLYDSGDATVPAKLRVKGSVSRDIVPARLSLSVPGCNPVTETSVCSYGNQIIGQKTVKTFTVTRAGTLPATRVLLKPFANSAFRSLGGTCTDTVTGPCEIIVEAAATSSGPHNSAFELEYFDGQSNAAARTQLNVTAQAPAGLGLFALQSLDFGGVSLRDTKDMTFSVRHMASDGVTARNINVTVGTSGFVSTAYSLISNACATASLSFNQNCTFTVRFQPTDAMTYPGQISVAYDNGYELKTVALAISGTGITRATLRLEPAARMFSRLVAGNSETQLFTLKYFGSDPAGLATLPNLFAAYSWLNGAFPGAGGTCANVVRQDCTFVVRFAPPLGQPNGTLYASSTPFVYTSGGQTLMTNPLALTGYSDRPATLAYSVTSVAFGNVSANRPVYSSVTVTNSGGVPARNIVSGPLGVPFAVQSTTCGALLNNGASCAIQFRFQSAAVGTYASVHSLSYDDGVLRDPAEDRPYIEVPLSGSTVSTPLLIAPSSLAFGNVFVGESKTLPITVSYYGLQSATQVSAVWRNGANGFTVSAIPSTASSSFSLNITFAPTARLSYQNTLDITYSNGPSRVTTSVAVGGRGIVPASLRVVTPLPVSFGTLSWKESLTLPVSILNEGDVAATLNSQSGLSAPFRVESIPNSFPVGTSVVQINFAPTSGAGTAYGSLRIGYLNGKPGTAAQFIDSAVNAVITDRAKLAVTAISQPAAAVLGGPPSLGSITIRHVAGRPATISSVGGIGGDFKLTLSPSATAPLYGYPASGTCGASISNDCNLPVYFVPTQGGTRTSVVSLQYNDGYAAAAVQATLVGDGQTPAVLSFNPNVAAFGSIGVNKASAPLTITVKKSGTAAASGLISSLPAPFRFYQGGYPGQGGTCGNTINADCTVRLELAPTAAGTYTRYYNLTYDNGAGSSDATLTLSAQVNDSATLAITPSSTEIPAVEVNENGAQVAAETVALTITNSASVPATGVVYSLSSGLTPFASSGQCGAVIAAGSSCSYRATFRPTRPGIYDFRLDVSYYNGLGTSTTSATLRGHGVVPVKVAVNGEHTCARTQYGKVKCWGSNSHGQLGLASNVRSTSTPTTDVPMAGNYWAKSVSVGVLHSCAILEGGEVKCWGDNTYGELGRADAVPHFGLGTGDTGAGFRTVPVGAVKELALGYSVSCALLDTAATNNVVCWGKNQRGQLGRGNTIDRGRQSSDFPLAAIDLAGRAKQISVKAAHVCAVMEGAAGTVKCWGSNFYGQLGLGDDNNRGDTVGEMGSQLPPVNLGASQVATAVVAAGGFSCALLASGTVKCWGKNGDGEERGNLGTEWCENESNQVGACGTGAYSEWIIGYGAESNQMGDVLPNIDLGTGRTAKAIDAGTSHACAILDNDRVKCWGDNNYGQLGLGDSQDRGLRASEMGDALPFIDFGSLQPVQSMSIGHYHGCVTNRTGTTSAVKCWGYNQYGGLGVSGSHRGDELSEMGDSLAALPASSL